MNVEQRQAITDAHTKQSPPDRTITDPQTKPIDLGCESIGKLLRLYSAGRLMLILPYRGK